MSREYVTIIPRVRVDYKMVNSQAITNLCIQ